MNTVMIFTILFVAFAEGQMPPDLMLRIRLAQNEQLFRARSGIDNVSAPFIPYVPPVDRNDDKEENIETTEKFGEMFSLDNLKYFKQNECFGDLRDLGISKIEKIKSIIDDEIKEINLMSNFLNDWRDDLSNSLPNLRIINFNDNVFSIFDISQFRLLAKLRTLSINANLIQVVCSKDVAQMPALTKLLLNKNRIENIEATAFDGLPSLKILDLSENQLKFLPENFLSSHRHMQRLKLNHNELSQIPISLYLDKPFLYQFEVSDNDLQWESLKPIFCLPKIKTVNIGENSIIAENTTVILACEKLTVLSWKDKKLARRMNIDMDSFHVVNLTRAGLKEVDLYGTALHANGRYIDVISLNHNSFKTLKRKSFLRLVNLIEIHLSFCEIENIQGETFSRLNKLRKLILNDNPITHLEMSIGIAPNVFLEVSRTNIEHVENRLQSAGLALSGRLQPTQINLGAFCENDRLAYLDLSNNSKSTLNLEMEDNSTACSIEILVLNKNNLTDLPDNFEKHMQKLKSLYLSDCKFEVANLKRICKLRNLTTVDFSSNQISTVELPSIDEQCLLETINLRQNKIKYLDTSSFTHLSRLKLLSLEQNYIESFVLSTLIWNMNSVTELYIHGNPVSNVVPIDTLTYPALTHEIKFLSFFFNDIEADLQCLSGFKHLQYLELEKSVGEFSLCTGISRYGNLDARFAMLLHFKLVGVTDLLTSTTKIRMPLLLSWTVQDSDLEQIDLDMFVIIAKSIRKLFLSGNNIQSVTATTITEKMHLSHLDLSQNPIVDFSFRAHLHPSEYKLLLPELNEII